MYVLYKAACQEFSQASGKHIGWKCDFMLSPRPDIRLSTTPPKNNDREITDFMMARFRYLAIHAYFSSHSTPNGQPVQLKYHGYKHQEPEVVYSINTM